MSVAGFTSTGSKHPEVLFGTIGPGTPVRMLSSRGCTVLGTDGRSYLDFVMALGAVALGYGHDDVSRAVDRVGAAGRNRTAGAGAGGAALPTTSPG